MINKLFESIEIGSIHLSNRIVMAPMTRSRAHADGTPGELAPLYYAQRASAGMLEYEAPRALELDEVRATILDYQNAAERAQQESLIIANGGYDAEKAEVELVSGRADLVSFGNLFIANPDLPARFKSGAPLMQADRATMYGGEEHGYTDYPPMSA